MRRILLAMLFAAVAGAATAQNARLSAAEVRAELYGVRLSGVLEGLNEPWQECIEPSGRTVFTFMRDVDEGRLSVDRAGRACFAYAHDHFRRPACFVVMRDGSNYRFDTWVTRQVERGVRHCEAGGAFVQGGDALSQRGL